MSEKKWLVYCCVYHNSEILRNPSAHGVFHHRKDGLFWSHQRDLDWNPDAAGLGASNHGCIALHCVSECVRCASCRLQYRSWPDKTSWNSKQLTLEGSWTAIAILCSHVHLCTSTRTSKRQSLHKGPGMAIAVEVHTWQLQATVTLGCLHDFIYLHISSYYIIPYSW